MDFRTKEIFNKPSLEIGAAEILCFFTAHNEASRIPFFLEYYRQQGVTRFFAIDNRSTDETAKLLQSQPDVHYFHTDQSYKESRAGRFWTGELADFYGQDRWCLTLDLDEILTFPAGSYLTLRDLVHYMDARGQRVLFTVFLDMYAPGRLRDAVYNEGAPFWETCNLFETSTYKVKPAQNFPPTQIVGGPRQRKFWDDGNLGQGPSMRKCPLVKWGKDARYIHSTHSLFALPLSDVVGATMHFKFFSSFAELAVKEVARGDRMQPADYSRYAEMVTSEEIVFENEESISFGGPIDLLQRGVMTCSDDFATYACNVVKRRIDPVDASLFQHAFRDALNASRADAELSLRHLPAIWPLISTPYSNPYSRQATPRAVAKKPNAVRVELEGCVVDSTGTRITGWAQDLSSSNEPMEISVRVNGQIVARQKADKNLPKYCDVPREVLGRGFVFDLSDLLAGDKRVLRADVLAGSSNVLIASDLMLYEEPTSISETRYEGMCENNSNGHARGWIWVPTSPEETVEVALYIDDEYWKRVPASRFRQDMLDLGMGTGYYGFAERLPSEILNDTQAHKITAFVADAGIMLRRAPVIATGQTLKTDENAA